MLTSNITPTGGVTVMVRPAIFLLIFIILIGRCYSQGFDSMADVIAIIIDVVCFQSDVVIDDQW